MGRLRSFKRILVFGAGAIGGYFGAKIAACGADVTFIARGERLEAMRKSGLTLMSDEGEKAHVAVNAAAHPEGLFDLIIISVKAKDTATAASACASHLEEAGAVLSLQNGVENPDILLKTFPETAVIGAVVHSGISVPEPGVILYKLYPSVILGAVSAAGRYHEKPLRRLFDECGVKCLISQDIRKSMWVKLLWNIAYNPLSALMLATCGELTENEHSMRIMKQIAGETMAAAAAVGIDLPDDTIEKTFDLNPVYINYKTSALQDVEAGRTPETDALMGTVVRMAGEGKIHAPVTETVYEMAKFKFERWFHISPRMAADVLVVNGDKVLLIERKNEPFGWAIPGGMVNYGETTEHAAVRELWEETGVAVEEKALCLLGIYSDPARDKRGHNVAVIYYVYAGDTPKAADDAVNAEYFPLDKLPVLVFDHLKVVEDFIRLKRL